MPQLDLETKDRTVVISLAPNMVHGIQLMYLIIFFIEQIIVIEWILKDIENTCNHRELVFYFRNMQTTIKLA